MTYTTQREVRKAFWFTMTTQTRKPSKYRGMSQNDMPADIRCAFVDFVDSLNRSGDISDRLAHNSTLA